MPQTPSHRGGIGFTQRGEKIEATFSVPKTMLPEGAPRKRITAHGATRQEAERKLLAKLSQANISAPASESEQHGGITVAEWFDEWLHEYAREGLQESTLNIYRGHIRNHINPYVGDVAIHQLTIRQLKHDWWDKIRALKKWRDGQPTDEPLLGAFALNNVYKTMKMGMDAANAKLRIPITISTTFFRTPKGRRPESDRDIAESAQRLQQLFYQELSHDDPLWSQFLFVLLGLRQGERLGLSVDSVIVTGNQPRLEISHQLDFLKSKGGWYLKDTTKNGQPREVPLWGEFLEAAQKRLELRQQWSQEPDWNPDPQFANLLFLQPGGKLLTRRSDTPMWHSLVGDMRGHLARHITGHLLAERGVSIDTAKILLGHMSDAYGTYYRMVSGSHVSRELSTLYQLSAAP